LVEGILSTEPEMILRATIYQKGQRIICSGAAAILASPAIQQRTLEEYLKEDVDIQWCLHDMKLEHSKEIAKGLREGTAMVVCDS
jgi:hypothetical protein